MAISETKKKICNKTPQVHEENKEWNTKKNFTKSSMERGLRNWLLLRSNFTCHEIGYDTIVHNEKLMPFARRLWVSISW
jgi:hypothetical protein